MIYFRKFLLPTIVFLFVLGIGAALLIIVEHDRIGELREAVNEVGIGQAYTLQRQLDRSLSSTVALAVLLRQDNEHKLHNFDELAAHMIESYGGISSLQLAPDGIVTRIYPLAGNEAAIGHDLLNDPGRRTEALAAIESRKLTLAGPFALIQGGVAVIGRLPVFVSDDAGGERFWGFTIALIGLSDLLEASKLGRLVERGYDYELSRIHPDSGERVVLDRSSEEDLREPLQFEIEVPNGMWSLSVAPRAGWRPETIFSLQVILVVFCGMFFSLLTYALQNRVAGHQQQAEETQKYKAYLLRNVSDAVIATDIDLRVTSWNRAAEKIYGWREDEVIGRDIDEVCATEFVGVEQEAAQKQLLDTGEWRGEVTQKGRNSETIYVMASVSLLKDARGNPSGGVTVNRDITERKQAEEALQKAHDELEAKVEERTAELHAAYRSVEEREAITRTLLDAPADAIVLVDRAGNIVDANQTVADRFGMRLCDILGGSIWDLVPADVAASRIKYMEQTLQSCEPVRWEDELAGMWFDNAMYPILGAEGEVLMIALLARDISERRKMEEDLRTKDLAIESAINGIGIADMNGMVTYVNDAVVKMWGYDDGKEIIGRAITEFWEGERIYETLRALNEEGGRIGEDTGKRRDGSLFPVEFSATVIRDDTGKPLCMFGSFIDITARKRTEATLKETQRQLHALAAHLHSVQEQERRTIAREMHDELGQILTSAKIDLRMISSDLADESVEREQLIPEIETVLQHLDSTIKQTRTLVTQLRPKILDDLGLLPAIEWQLDEFGRRTSLQCSLTSMLEQVDLDVERATPVFRIFQEALTNIARHAQATEVRVILDSDDGKMRLEITDNGVGFEEDKRGGELTFGLLGMKERASMLSGDLEIISRGGEGTTVRLTVPIP